MALCREIVDFVGLHLLDDANEIGRIGQITVMQLETDVLLVRVLVQMIDAIGIEGRRPALDAMNVYPFCSRNSARYAPSWPVIPVINARFDKFPLPCNLYNLKDTQ